MRAVPVFFAAVSLVLGPGAAQSQASRLHPSAQYLGHGISHELARFRASTISDVRYELSLDLGSLDSAVGHVQTRFLRGGPGDVVVDFRGRRVVRISVNSTSLPLSTFNGNHIRVPASVLKAGRNVLDIGFITEIAPAGASIIRAHDPDGSDYIYTLLVPADANQLFPCFDQPDLKARVSLTLTTPSGWTALSNGSSQLVGIDDPRGAGAGRVTTRFAETRPLSTYLIAFAAGPWQRATSVANGRTVNAYFRRSRAKEVDVDSLLALNHRALAWMEQYFGRAYPFEKYDFLLAPAFPFGGMEHPGLVMFNEDRFIFRERPTLSRRLGRFSTILHEVAHQWFGDLVTMRWFDDLWLKEGFATYMAAKALDALEPSSDAWKMFYLSNKPAAYGVDQTAGTTPLWQQLANLDQAKSAYGAIVYNKAPSVLRQLNYLVGEEAFRAGVQRFLSDHAYANASWRDLLDAVGRAGGTSLEGFGRNFMTRPGMPIVEPHIEIRAGVIERLVLIQRPAREAISGRAPWPMRTQVVLRYQSRPPVKLPVALTGGTTEVTAARGLPAPLFVFPNADDYGYFLSLLDSASVRALESGALATIDSGFLRAMLWGALWDQVRDTRLEPARFAKLLLAALPLERDEQLLPILLGRLERTLRAYLSGAGRREILGQAEQLLWEGAADAGRSYGPRRSQLDAFVSIAATPDGIHRLESLLTADSAAGEPVRDPTRWEVVNRLLVLNAASAESAFRAQSARDTTPDGRRRAFIAGAARRSAPGKATYFARYFGDKALNEDWASGSLGAFNTLEHGDLTLAYLRPALDSLPFIQANRRIFFLGTWLGTFLSGQTSDAAIAIVRDFLREHPALAPDLRQKVLQNADELERTVLIRRRWE